MIGTVNAAGGSLPPHITVTEDAPEGSTWSVSDSGWTKQGIALLWFKESFLPNIGSHRPQVLILDGHDSHNFIELIDSAVENDIHIIELTARTSNWLQPCDRTLVRPLKNAYNKACEDLMTNFPGSVVSRASFCGLFKRAWMEAVNTAIIISGFRSCGIYPFNPEAVPPEAFFQNSIYSVSE